MNEETRPFAAPGQSPPPPSATSVARDEAVAVGQSAAQAGQHVVQTAADQARETAAQATRHARDLLSEAGAQTRDQAATQQQKAARQLRGLAGELQEMADKGGQGGLATQVAQQAAARIHATASWLEQREPADLLAQARDFARHRPGAFLAGAAVAGLVAGRLTRGIATATRSPSQPDPQPRSQGPVPPAAATPPDIPAAVPGYSASEIPAAGSGADPHYPAGGVSAPGYPAEDLTPGYPAADVPVREYPSGGVPAQPYFTPADPDDPANPNDPADPDDPAGYGRGRRQP